MIAQRRARTELFIFEFFSIPAHITKVFVNSTLLDGLMSKIPGW